MSFNPLTITFFLYIFAMIAIGFIAYRATQNLSDYILGGRSLGSVVTALSAGASDMSGWLLMGLPGAIYLAGLSESWIAIGLTLGAYLNWLFVAGRLRVFTEFNNNALTLPDYFHSRFEDDKRLLKIFAALIILFFFLIYCASGIVAGARLFQSTFNMNYDTALWVGALATILYVFIGGFLAVSWTDTIQATLMIFALLLLPTMVILSLSDLPQTMEIVLKENPNFMNIFHNMTTIGIISLLAWGLGYFGQPHILVRFMAAESVNTIPKARRISITWMALCLFGAICIGFFGRAYFTQNAAIAGIVNGDSEKVFMELAKYLLNPWVAGIVLSGVLAAVMSTLSCQLLVSSSALTEDLYKGFFRRNASDRELVWVGRFMVFMIAAIAIFIAKDPNSKVLSLVSYAWAGFGAAFGPVVILSLLWKGMTRNGALAGMIVGALSVIVYKNIVPIYISLTYGGLTDDQYQNISQGLFDSVPILSLYEIIPGFILATIAIVVFSKIGQPASNTMQQRFDDATKAYLQ
ncbi:sodium/proline symporter [Wohlfahrtiimonas chitiniclastica]|uniref:sodium/proline symporter PutP n=1 Tax=Wohlfahrtiimonas chitiniclastica TaxID=400946 RepID=UPI0007B69BFA|nr:sodium/proline symporter PutP [Wohlfahrtiimonas chitiniclastica]KZX37566.1 sodium:proline symporter [Wohlfahrtiimonas chitiniclastica]OYQ70090.1 sodium/proline symporter [Wohlfahrtiimonas chitiniclastica]OYQ78439.1 sodium/proline symporter [Wohlfahrtiimonas chitiniclastica]OYQ79615.1 sodium/proline symporter [Wohlfahrtiimonas chitiniclastica]OYQ83335.1 sodium/proline symporter [Wohlfahrtiimonas chitiniclastica]